MKAPERGAQHLSIITLMLTILILTIPLTSGAIPVDNAKIEAYLKTYFQTGKNRCILKSSVQA